MASHPRPETELKGNSKVGLTVLGKKRKQPLFVLQAAIKAETRLRKDIGAHGDVILTSSLRKKLPIDFAMAKLQSDLALGGQPIGRLCRLALRSSA